MPYALTYRNPATITPGGSDWQKTQGEDMYGSFWPSAVRTATTLHVTVGASTTLKGNYHLHMDGRYDVTVNLDQATGALSNTLAPNGEGAVNPIPGAVKDFALRATPCLFSSAAVSAPVTVATPTTARRPPAATTPPVVVKPPVPKAPSAPVVSAWTKPRPF